MTKVHDIMKKNVITVRADVTMIEAQKLMTEHNVRHLPVVDEYGILEGMLSSADFKTCTDSQRTSPFHLEQQTDKEAMVSDYMSWPVLIISERDTVESAAEQMLAQKISALVVTDAGNTKLKGIVTLEDVLNHYIGKSQTKHLIADLLR